MTRTFTDIRIIVGRGTEIYLKLVRQSVTSYDNFPDDLIIVTVLDRIDYRLGRIGCRSYRNSLLRIYKRKCSTV